MNPEVDPDIPSMIAASAALAVSGVPFNGPIAAARVGYINNEYVLCPNLSQMKDSKLDLVVAGTERAVLFGSPEAESKPAAFFNNTAAGGVFVMKLNDLS